MARIGIFGGSFNPPHIGHLILAQEAVEQLQLDDLLLIPVNRAPHKENTDDPGAKFRYRMCELAVSGDDRISASDIEIKRPGRSYTVETLRFLKAQRSSDSLFLILGVDMALTLNSWRDPDELLQLAELAVVGRQGHELGEVQKVLDTLNTADHRCHTISMPRVDISSTLIRSYCKESRSIRYLVPEAVADYIQLNDLYSEWAD